jgi:hypothetical protein
VKVTISISHGEAEDLAQVEAAARRLGMTIAQRGSFMGVHHAEFSGQMTARALTDLLSVEPDVSAVAA